MFADFNKIKPFENGSVQISHVYLNWLLIINSYPPIVFRSDTKEQRNIYYEALGQYYFYGNLVPLEELIESKVTEAIIRLV